MIGKTVLQRVAVTTAIVTGAALVIAGLLWLLTGLAPVGRPPAGGAGQPVDQRESLPLSGVTLISVESKSEHVRVVEGAGDVVEAWLHGTISMGSADMIPRFMTKADGATVKVWLEYPRVDLRPRWIDLDLEIRVPSGYAGSLRVECSSGDINAADHAYADCELIASSGDIRAAGLRAARATLRTSSGDISVESLDASDASLGSSSGHISVKAIGATGRVSVETPSGDVGLGFSTVPRETSVECSSGDAVVSLPADATFTLDARASSGDVRCDFPITIAGGASGHGEHELSGAVGGATGTTLPSVRVHTRSGDIRVQRR